MENKVYYDEELEEILNCHIKEEKYGGFKPLLNEIFQRRAYEYRFDHQHMEKEVINFVKNVKAIEFGRNIPELKSSSMGAYDRNRKRIYFNCEAAMFQREKIPWLELYGTLTHEIYHAISYDDLNGCMRITQCYKKTGSSNK